MKSLIVTEGKLVQLLLEGILRSEPRLRGRYKVVAGGSGSSAVPLARTYLVTRDARVVLVTDADTDGSEDVPTQRLQLVEALGSVAAADRYLALVAVPAVEGLLFSDRKLAESLFDRKFTAAEWKEARRGPKAMLAKLIGGDPTNAVSVSKFQRFLLRHDLTPFVQAPLVKEIKNFVLRPAALDSGVIIYH
jgi:hypothetical protein